MRPLAEFYDEMQFRHPLDIWIPRFKLLAENIYPSTFRQLAETIA